jgi:hypothetical protein
VTAWAAADGEPSSVVAWIRATVEWLETVQDAASKRDADPNR